MTRRRLSPEEIELWRKVVKQTERLQPDAASTDDRPAPLPKPIPIKAPKHHFEPFRFGQSAKAQPVRHDLKPDLIEQLQTASLNMDRKAYQRMKRGKLKPDARLDLHGMRVDTAHPALIRFILNAQASGHRLVLVITGKGKSKPDDGPIPTPRGVLKHQVPQWLSLPPLSQAVLQVSAAHLSHGGEGAYYVYLRRNL